MKRNRSIIFAIALTVAAAVVPAAESRPNGKLDEILANMQKLSLIHI